MNYRISWMKIRGKSKRQDLGVRGPDDQPSLRRRKGDLSSCSQSIDREVDDSDLDTSTSKIIDRSETSLQSSPKGSQFAEPVCLLELVSYQEGSVISRALTTSKSGNMTMFSFDQGQGLSEHVSPFNAFVQILEGTAEITVSGKRMQANEGEIMILPANQPHSLNALSRFKMLLTMIRSE
jgi:quercetin dioxygenase-like cupin family protein